MKLRHVTYGFLAALLVLALLGWLLASSRSTPINSISLAKIFFTGYSNAPDGRVFAWFCITNPTDYKILYYPTTVEMRSGGEWSRPPHNGREKELAPHASISINIAKPAGVEAWRVTTFNGLAPPTWKPVVERFTWFVPSLGNWLDRKYPLVFGPSSSEPRTD